MRQGMFVAGARVCETSLPRERGGHVCGCLLFWVV